MRRALGLAPLHLWLRTLPADSGERFLYDYYVQQAAAAPVLGADSRTAALATAHTTALAAHVDAPSFRLPFQRGDSSARRSSFAM